MDITPNKQNGFTQFEFIIVVILISILSVVALNRMWAWRAEIEQTFIKTVSGNIRSALGMQTAQLALHGKLKQLPQLAGTNPFSLLAQKPDQYLGELSADDPKTQQAGIWYFDTKQKALIYTIKHADDFRSTLKGRARIRLMIRLIYSDLNLNRRYDTGVDSIAGLDLVSLDDYHWEATKSGK